MQLRTGAARMLLEAAAMGAQPITLLPVGLVLHEPGRFRSGRGLLLVGDPVETKDCVALHRSDPTTAVHRLTDRLAIDWWINHTRVWSNSQLITKGRRRGE